MLLLRFVPNPLGSPDPADHRRALIASGNWSRSPKLRYFARRAIRAALAPDVHPRPSARPLVQSEGPRGPPSQATPRRDTRQWAVNVVDALRHRPGCEDAAAERRDGLAGLENRQRPVTWDRFLALLVGKTDRLDIADETRGQRRTRGQPQFLTRVDAASRHAVVDQHRAALAGRERRQRPDRFNLDSVSAEQAAAEYRWPMAMAVLQIQSRV